MKTLKEEREAIVEEFFKTSGICTHKGLHIENTCTGILHLASGDEPKLKDALRTTLLSHEEKVVARVREMLDEEMEHFADMEHGRWSKWQKYMHSKCVEHEKGDGEWVCFPSEFMKRWNRQIDTPYAELSEAERESDREQVRPYLNYIKSKLTALTLPITDEKV